MLDEIQSFTIEDLLTDSISVTEGVASYIVTSLVQFWNTQYSQNYSYLRDTKLKDSVNEYILNNFRNRELIVPQRVLDLETDELDTIRDVVAPYIQHCVDSTFKENNENWQRMYDALTAEYNPLWNVDGTETRTYTKTNTGTQENELIKTGNITDNVNFVGTETNSHNMSGSKSNSVEGEESDSNTISGKEKDELTYTGKKSTANTKEGFMQEDLTHSGKKITTNEKLGTMKEDTEFKGSEISQHTMNGSMTDTTTMAGAERKNIMGAIVHANTPYDSSNALLSDETDHNNYYETTEYGVNTSGSSPRTDTVVHEPSANYKETDAKSYGVNASGTQDTRKDEKTTTYGDVSNNIPIEDKTTEEYDSIEPMKDSKKVEYSQDYVDTTTEQYDPNTPMKETHIKEYLDNYSNDNAKTFSNSEEHEYSDEGTDTKSFTNRADNRTTTYNSVTDADTRTDNLQEEYEEVLERHGNIGVTKSTDLVESEVLVRLKYNMTKIISKGIINNITYMC